MPSASHESLVALFRDCPALAADLLGRATAAERPDLAAATTPRVTSAEFATLDPAEYRADVVIRLDTPDDRPAEVIIVEVQLDRDGDKLYTWPHYLTGARARFRCPATLLVVTLDPAVARWCAQPIALDRAANVITPVVMGPDAIPCIRDVAQARAFPELAVLSAAAHGNDDDGAEPAAAALLACAGLDNPRSGLYADFILASLGQAARRALETLMSLHKYEYQSEFAKKYFAQGLEEGLEKGLEEGREKGLEEGREKGLEEGREKGREEGMRAVLLRQLSQRFGELPAAIRDRVAGAGLDALELWTERVIPAQALADVFDDA